LDTHIWLWALNQPERLGRRVRRQIESPKNELYLSPVSIWEAHLLSRGRNVRIPSDFAGWLRDAFLSLPVIEAPFNFPVATEAARIQIPQRDIGDVFIAATAVVQNLILVTADVQLLECSWLKTLANE
jgi:PIN domain nuclease of toxin-antitoxin system